MRVDFQKIIIILGAREFNSYFLLYINHIRRLRRRICETEIFNDRRRTAAVEARVRLLISKIFALLFFNHYYLPKGT